jgi:predicted transcriptional regulator with HTH domain
VHHQGSTFSHSSVEVVQSVHVVQGKRQVLAPYVVPYRSSVSEMRSLSLSDPSDVLGIGAYDR